MGWMLYLGGAYKIYYRSTLNSHSHDKKLIFVYSVVGMALIFVKFQYQKAHQTFWNVENSIICAIVFCLHINLQAKLIFLHNLNPNFQTETSQYIHNVKRFNSHFSSPFSWTIFGLSSAISSLIFIAFLFQTPLSCVFI